MTKWKLKNKWWVSIHLFKLEELIQIQEKNMKYHPPKKSFIKSTIWQSEMETDSVNLLWREISATS